jgi:hypothetical protein
MSHPDRRPPHTLLNEHFGGAMQEAYDTWSSLPEQDRRNVIQHHLTQILNANDNGGIILRIELERPGNQQRFDYYRLPYGCDPLSVMAIRGKSRRDIPFYVPICDKIPEKTARQLVATALIACQMLTQSPSILPTSFTQIAPDRATLTAIKRHTFRGAEMDPSDLSGAYRDSFSDPFSETGPAATIDEGILTVMLSFVQLLAGTPAPVPIDSGTSDAGQSLELPSTEGTPFTPANMRALIEEHILDKFARFMSSTVVEPVGVYGLVIDGVFYVENGVPKWNSAQQYYRSSRNQTGIIETLSMPGCPLSRYIDHTQTSGIDPYARFFADIFQIISNEGSEDSKLHV